MIDSHKKSYALMVLATFLWGASWTAKKIALTLSSAPLTIGFFRYLSASLLFIILISATGKPIYKRFTREHIKPLLIIGTIGVFGAELVELYGLSFTTAAQGAILDGLQPAVIGIFAYLMLKEKLTPRWKMVGFIFSFIGVAFVVGIQTFLDFNLDYLIGNILLLIGICLWAIYSVLGKSAMKKMSPVELMAGISIIATMYFGVGAITDEFWALSVMSDALFWLSVLFLGMIVTFLAYLFYFESINIIGPTKAGIFVSLVPVFGAILSWYILEEVLYWTFIIGLIFIIIGISILNYPTKTEQVIKNEG
ncbi:MAG: DMT family transporter [Candidatus Thorarchaeota archaeon]